MAESGPKPPNDIQCFSENDCVNVTNAVCDAVANFCKCDDILPIYVASIAECTRVAQLNATCHYDEQCLAAEDFSQCSVKDKRCICLSGYTMQSYEDIGVNCVTAGKSSNGVPDPAMIWALVALALMFVIICVVLRLFSKARFRENRSIFNTPNPRLMNASLFKDRRRDSTLSTASATGSAAAAAQPSGKSSTPTTEEKEHKETTVAIETVD